MSVEDFRVQLVSSSGRDAAMSVLLAHGFKKDFDVGQSETHLRWENDSHIIEATINDATPGEISILVRFALCQAPTIDSYFIDILNNVKRDLHAEFAGAGDTLNTISREIVVERGYWQQSFGTETARLTCREALMRFVVGR